MIILDKPIYIFGFPPFIFSIYLVIGTKQAMEFITIEFYLLHQNFPIGEFDRFIRESLLCLPGTFSSQGKWWIDIEAKNVREGNQIHPKGRLEGERSAFLHE